MNRYSYKDANGSDFTEHKNDFCEHYLAHPETAQGVKSGMPDEEVLFELAELFALFGESSRLKILSALFISELCVCEISAAVSMTQSAVSHQLRLLKQSRLVKSRREGKTMVYSLSDDHIKSIFDLGVTHVLENDGEKK